MRSRKNLAMFCWMVLISCFAAAQASQQPAEPIDITPIDGGVYYLLNQLGGLNADLNNNSTLAGDHIVQQQPSFTSLSQRWMLTRVADGVWQISNTGNGLCLASAGSERLCMPRTWGAREGAETVRRNYSASCPVVQDPCAATAVQQWSLMATSNGYYMIANKSTGLLIGLSQGATSAGAALVESELLGGATQSQQWLLRPAFFRGIDNALLEKQESARVAMGLPWWNDAGQQEDVQESWHQRSAPEAQFSSSLCERVCDGMLRQFLLRRNGDTGSGSREAREEPRDEYRTDAAVRRRQLFQCPACVG